MTDLQKLTRRQIRYILFRLQTEAGGGAPAKYEKEAPMKYVDAIREHFESQDDFGGWTKFAKTWDVDDKSPLVAILRTSSIQTEWGKILSAEAKELPTTPPKKKFLQNALAQKIQKKRLVQIRKNRNEDLDI